VCGGVFGVLLLAGCAGGPKREWLALFFDGVPVKEVANAKPAEAPQAAEPTTNAPLTQVTAKTGASMRVHVPFGDRLCGECHESQFSHKLKGKLPDLCFTCHDDFLEKAKFRHAPAESGECTFCHNPHESSQRWLLVENAPRLCFECHDPSEMEEVKAHGPVGADACTTCHDPHQGERRFFLKPREDKSLNQQASAHEK